MCGYDPKLVREGKVYEAATLTCAHCGNAWNGCGTSVVIKNPLRTREREYCRLCDHYICDFCGIERQQTGYAHVPFKAKVDSALEKAAIIEQVSERFGLPRNLGEAEQLGSPLALVDPPAAEAPEPPPASTAVPSIIIP
jgi:hypothetical protein